MAAILRLVRENPAALGLYTFTAQDDTHMAAVDRRLGYREAATWEMYVHEVDGAPPTSPGPGESR